MYSYEQSKQSLNTFLQHNGANIQLLDLPGIIEGAAQGRLNFNVDLLTFASSDLEDHYGCWKFFIFQYLGYYSMCLLECSAV